MKSGGEDLSSRVCNYNLNVMYLAPYLESYLSVNHHMIDSSLSMVRLTKFFTFYFLWMYCKYSEVPGLR
jgi:hypothetical protein